MGKKRIIVALLTLAFALGAFALSRQEHASAARPAVGDQPSAPAQANGQEIPEHVTYDVLFRQIDALKKKAAELDSRGIDGGGELRKFVYREAKLDDKQAEKLDKIQTEYMGVVEKMDAKAKKIIQEARAQHPHGRLAEGQPLPEPPQELKALQNKRNNLTLQARSFVREALGEQEFQRFGQFVKEHIADRLRPVEARGGRPEDLGAVTKGKSGK
jgi:hypothetical protein